MKIYEQFPNVKRVIDAEIGIEIEAEGVNLWPRANADGRAVIGHWSVVRDGSLRGENPAEYVLTKPLARAGVSKALKELIKWHKDHESVVDNSDRAGVHIHINVQDLTVEQTINFILMYLLFEDLLVKFCGESREGNLFCLRAQDADKFIDTLRKAKSISNLIDFQQDTFRYASVNVSALRKYGTLEFRAFRTPTKLLEIEDWINLLLCVKDASLKVEDSREIVDKFSKAGPVLYLKSVFGQFSDLLKFPNISSTLYDSVRRIQDVAYTKQLKKDERVYKDENLIRAGVNVARAGNRINLRPPILLDPIPLPDYPGFTHAESHDLIQLAFQDLDRRELPIGLANVAGHAVNVTDEGITIDNLLRLDPPPRVWVRRIEYGRNTWIFTNRIEPDDVRLDGPHSDNELRHPETGPMNARDTKWYRRPLLANEYRRGWVLRDGEYWWAYDALPSEPIISLTPDIHPMTGNQLTQAQFDRVVWNGVAIDENPFGEDEEEELPEENDPGGIQFIVDPNGNVPPRAVRAAIPVAQWRARLGAGLFQDEPAPPQAPQGDVILPPIDWNAEFRPGRWLNGNWEEQ